MAGAPKGLWRTSSTRAAWVVAWVAALALGMAVPATAEPARTGAVPTEISSPAPVGARTPVGESPALTQLVSCLAERKAGDLVLLIDTSGSLGGPSGTDPTGVRVAAAQALASRLSDSFAQIGAQVDVSVAGFDDDVTQVLDFSPLTATELPKINDALGQFGAKNKGAETDYWTALTWLTKTLQAKAKARGSELGASCQVALWFTDGSFTISARDGSSDPALDPLTNPTKDIPGFENVPLTDSTLADNAKAAATAELCRVGGPVDQMRAAGITLIAVGLGTGADDPTFDFMRDYTENRSGKCGSQPSRGLFVPAASVGDLFLTLDGLFDGVTTAPPPQKLCQVQVCPEGSYPFTLDNTLSKVHLAAVVHDAGSLIRDGLRVEVTPPGGGAPIVIEGGGPDAGAATTATAAAAFKWYSGGPLTIDLTRAGADWAGDWAVTFIDTTGKHPDAVSNVNLSLTSDFAVVPTLAGSAAWRAGERSGGIEFRPQTVGGADVAVTDLPAGFTIKATLTYPGRNESVPLDASLGTPTVVDIPSDVASGLALVKVDLNGQVAGKPLAVVSKQLSVKILPPFGSPAVDPNQVLDFGFIEGAAPAVAQLQVAGPEVGDGCVGVQAGELLSTPQSVSSVTLTGAQNGSCFPVPAGQTVPLTVTLTPGQDGTGHLEGNLTVLLAPADKPGQVTRASVRYRAEMQRLPQEQVKSAILIGTIVLGLLIAAAMMLLARRWSARFPGGHTAVLQSTVLDIKVGSGRLGRADGGSIGLPSGMVPVPPPGPGRRTLMLSGVPLRAQAGWRLTEPGYAKVDDFGGADTVGASSVAPHSDPKGRPRLPLSVQGTWTVLVPRTLAQSPLDEVPGRLLLVIDTSADDAARQHLASSAERDAPALVQEARERARAATGTDVDPSPPPDSRPQYPAFGQPDPPSAGDDATGGWGQPAAPGPGGWGQPRRPEPGSWGQPGPPHPPPRGDGW